MAYDHLQQKATNSVVCAVYCNSAGIAFLTEISKGVKPSKGKPSKGVKPLLCPNIVSCVSPHY